MTLPINDSPTDWRFTPRSTIRITYVHVAVAVNTGRALADSLQFLFHYHLHLSGCLVPPSSPPIDQLFRYFTFLDGRYYERRQPSRWTHHLLEQNHQSWNNGDGAKPTRATRGIPCTLPVALLSGEIHVAMGVNLYQADLPYTVSGKRMRSRQHFQPSVNSHPTINRELRSSDVRITCVPSLSLVWKISDRNI